MRWRTRFGAVLGRLPVGRPSAKCMQIANMAFCGTQVWQRCCMYGPSYVKRKTEHRAFAAQLLVVFIAHCALCRAIPGPIWPPLARRPCHHRLRLHSPRPHKGTATPSDRDPNLGSGNHDMSRLPAFAYLNDAHPIQGLADIRLAHSQRILGVTPSPLALAQALQHILLAN
jgi:hypothetical protein